MQTCLIKIFSSQSHFTAIKRVDTVTKQKHVSVIHDIKCTCKIQWYTICMVSLLILEIVILIILKVRKLKLFRGHFFSNAVKIMPLISGAQYCVPKKCVEQQEAHIFFQNYR